MDQEGKKKGRNSWQSWKSVHGYALKQIVVNGSGRKLERNKFLVIGGKSVYGYALKQVVVNGPGRKLGRNSWQWVRSVWLLYSCYILIQLLYSWLTPGFKGKIPGNGWKVGPAIVLLTFSVQALKGEPLTDPGSQHHFWTFISGPAVASVGSCAQYALRLVVHVKTKMYMFFCFLFLMSTFW